MKILLAGGTGFIGKELLKKLSSKGHSVILLTRNPEKYKFLEEKNITFLSWDGKSLNIKNISNIDAVINLSGQGIADSRWTEKYKKLIYNSRIDSTRALTKAISSLPKKPSVFVNASAIGFYGETGNQTIDETSSKGKGFLADVCADWEAEANKIKDITRVVLVRIGVVLEKEGGAIKKMLPPFMMFAGGPLGSGKQYVPWIHRDDVVNIILFSLENNNIAGPINATAPNPVTMSDFSKAFGKSIGRPSWAPVPSFAVRLLLGEMADLLLGSNKIIPKKLIETKYQFLYENIDSAFQGIFHS